VELWFNIESGGWKEISGGGEEGAKGGDEAIANQIVGSNFVDSSTLKDMITEWVFVLATWAEGFISFVE
jgi:hypothetical protein